MERKVNNIILQKETFVGVRLRGRISDHS